MALIGIVILLLVVGGATYYYLQNSKTNNVSSTDYKNSLLGYELTVPLGWHVSEGMSKRLDADLFMLNSYASIGCDTNMFIEKYNDEKIALQKLQECLKKSPDLMKSDSKYKDFEKNWTIENSQNIYITKLSLTEQQRLSLVDLQLPQSNLPKGSFVLIRPADVVLSFEKATTSTNGKSKRDFYYLGDKTKTYLTDFRNSKVLNDLFISIPISSKLSMLYNGGKIQSLTIISTADINSQEEKDFFKIMDSLKLTN